MQFKNLLKPGKIGKLELKNRITMPATGTRFGSESGEVSERQINWVARRAKGGVAMIVSEPFLVATSV